MRITIGPPGIAGTELQADNELRRAFGVLHGAGILTRAEADLGTVL